MKALKIVICKAVLLFALEATHAQDIPSPSLIELEESVRGKDQAKAPPALEIAKKFKKQLGTQSLEPASDLAERLLASERILIHLTNVVLQTKANISAPETQEVMAAIHLYFAKTDSLIEEGYQRRTVFPNVSPPPGIPNSASGMDPNAIQDLALRQQYLDLIKKNQDNGFKNSQQSSLASTQRKVLILAGSIAKWAESQGMPRQQILEKLTPEGKSRSLLEKATKPTATKFEK